MEEMKYSHPWYIILQKPRKSATYKYLKWEKKVRGRLSSSAKLIGSVI